MCSWLVGYPVTDQLCLSRSAQSDGQQGPTVRCRVYFERGHFVIWSTFFIPCWDELAHSWEGSRPALGWEWGSALPRLAKKTSAKRTPLKTQLEPRVLLYPPHSISGLRGESEGWFNFHPGSPHAWGPQMWQMTRVGILVWSPVCWVWLDVSSSFNLSRMDLGPGAEGLNSHYQNLHPAHKPFSQGNQLLAKRPPPPDGF